MPLIQGVDTHGYAGYAHGCRCYTCGLAKLKRQRKYRAQKPRAWTFTRLSKYEVAGREQPSSPDIINAWKDKLRGMR